MKFRQASNHCKRFLELPNSHMLIKTKESITSQKHGSRDFWQIANSVLNKGKSAIPPLINGPEVLSFVHLIKQNCLLNTVLRTLILMTQIISLLVFPSGTNLKLSNIYVTPTVIKKVIMNLDLSKLLIVFQWWF